MNAPRQTMVIRLQNTSTHVLMSINDVVTYNQLFFDRTTFCKVTLSYKFQSSIIIIPNLSSSSLIETVGVS